MQIVAFDGAAVGVEHSITITQKKKSFMLGCASAQEREAWLADLNAVIQQHKSKQKSFRKASVGEDDSEEPENKLGYGYEAPVWIPDSGVSMCQTCASGFSILRRRHHCRLCGKVCCGPCSGYQLPIGYDGGANGRVCVECFAEYGDDKNEDVKKKLLQIREKMSEKSALKQAAKGFQRDRGAMMAGYLSVRQGKKTYKRFWYVLMQDFCLYQYRRPEDVVAVSSLPLPGYAVQMHPKGTLGVDRDYVLAVCHPSLKPAYFDTESEAFCEEWLKVLSSATRAELPPGMTVRHFSPCPSIFIFLTVSLRPRGQRYS